MKEFLTKNIQYILRILSNFSDEARCEIFAAIRAEYCMYCGGPSRCHCMNDE
jgi:hypothetical protein